MPRSRKAHRNSNLQSHDQLVKKLMARPGERAEVDPLEREESALLDALLKARQDVGKTQA